MLRAAYGRREPRARVDGVVWEVLPERFDLSTTTNASALRALFATVGITTPRASSATVQTSTSTVVTSGIGVDDPRVGDAGFGRGLVVEESRQNKLTRSDTSVTSLAWGLTTAGGNTLSYETAAGAGPDGGNAVRLTSSAVTGSFCHWYMSAGVASAAAYTLSAWLRGEVGGETTYLSSTPNGVTYFRTTCGLTTGWQRFAATGTASAAAWYAQIGTDRRDASQGSTLAQITRAALAQYELGAWTSELILTSGAAATRQPDRVLLDSAARVVRSGRIGLAVRAALKGSIGGSNDFAADPYLWRYDGNNYASINRTSGAVTVVIAGASYTTAAGFTAARGDVLEYWLEAGGGSLQTVVKARKSTNGGVTFGSPVVLGTSSSPHVALASSGAVDLFSAAGSSHFSAWVQRVQAYESGRRPSWAA